MIKDKPKWIGAVLNTPTNGKIRVCIGINVHPDTDDPHEVSFCSDEDITIAKLHDENPWNTNADIIVKEGDKFVFNENHELV